MKTASTSFWNSKVKKLVDLWTDCSCQFVEQALPVSETWPVRDKLSAGDWVQATSFEAMLLETDGRPRLSCCKTCVRSPSLHGRDTWVFPCWKQNQRSLIVQTFVVVSRFRMLVAPDMSFWIHSSVTTLKWSARFQDLHNEFCQDYIDIKSN